ncbi:hypothetical protein [Streptacidiphilus sp. EB129]|uniref:hypothetical protein n=1 Tax=Streptacidiphilus sp. EB129 TaxID=3156262 RepID=UPI003516F7F0
MRSPEEVGDPSSAEAVTVDVRSAEQITVPRAEAFTVELPSTPASAAASENVTVRLDSPLTEEQVREPGEQPTVRMPAEPEFDGLTATTRAELPPTLLSNTVAAPPGLASQAADAAVDLDPAALGTGIRFGPGVPDPRTARTVAVWRGATVGQAAAEPPQERKRRRRPWLLLLLLLLALLAAVAAWLLWRPFGPPIAVTSVSVNAAPATLSCGGVESLTATVHTNGRAGTLHYQWIRGDGTSSGPLTQEVTADMSQVELPLRWTVQGSGSFHGTAVLRLSSPTSAQAAAGFDYTCR